MIDVAAIRRRHPIAEVIAYAGVTLERSGQRLVGRCPLHADQEPSLAVYPRTQSYFCYGCEAGGDVIDFVGRLYRLDFLDAAAWLDGHTQRPESARHNDAPLPSLRRSRERRAADRAAIEVAVSLYARQLEHSGEALRYLASRGVTREAARGLRLGYAAGGLAAALRKPGSTEAGGARTV